MNFRMILFFVSATFSLPVFEVIEEAAMKSAAISHAANPSLLTELKPITTSSTDHLSLAVTSIKNRKSGQFVKSTTKQI